MSNSPHANAGSTQAAGEIARSISAESTQAGADARLGSKAAAELAALPLDVAVKRVLSTSAAAAFVGLSVASWERLRAAGKAPPAVRLSERKLGYQVSSLVSWIEARSEGSAA